MVSAQTSCKIGWPQPLRCSAITNASAVDESIESDLVCPNRLITSPPTLPKACLNRMVRAAASPARSQCLASH